MRKLSSEKLRTKLAKIYKIEEKHGPEFENLRFEIETELNKRNFAAIYHAACRHLKLKRINNQFEAASIYADAVINGYDYAPTQATKSAALIQRTAFLTQFISSLLKHIVTP